MDNAAQILLTFLAALLGIPAGFALEHSLNKRRDKARHVSLTNTLRETLERNRDLLNNIQHQLTKADPIFFNVELTVLESTGATMYELLDPALCAGIDSIRYELAHFAREVDILLELEFNATARGLQLADGRNFYESYRTSLVVELNEHVDVIIPVIAAALKKLA
jgi:hypothetical protein